jgi:hypothetical protein
MGVRISVFAPYLCNTSVSGLDEYADGCIIPKGADWYPFLSGGVTGREAWGVSGLRGVHPKKTRAFQKQNNEHPPGLALQF